MLACKGIRCVHDGLDEHWFPVGRAPTGFRSIGKVRARDGKRCETLFDQDQ